MIKVKNVQPVVLEDPMRFGNNLAKLEEVLSNNRDTKNPIILNIVIMDVLRRVNQKDRVSDRDDLKFSIVKEISK